MRVTATGIVTPLPAPEVDFTIGYEGAAVAERRMAVRDLAPAMLALSDLVEHSSAALFGDDVRMRVEVKANFRSGSFLFDLVAIAPSIGDLIRSNLSLSDIAVLLQAIGITGRGLFGALRDIAGRSVHSAKVEPTPDGFRSIYIVGSNNTVIVTEDRSADLYVRPKVMEALQEATEPLRRPGYDELKVAVADEKPRVVATKAEAESFRAPPTPDVTLQDTTREELVRVVSPSLEDGYMWRLGMLGDRSFQVAVSDPEFLSRVQNREVTFGADDVLRVQLRTIVTRSAQGEDKRTVEVVKVLEYIPAPRVVQGDLLRDNPYKPD